MGHQLVNADWNRLSPTNPVNRNQYWFTHTPSATLTITKNPAIMRR
jgi:hypothetical protein